MNTRIRTLFIGLSLLVFASLAGWRVGAQVSQQPSTPVQIGIAYPMTAISSTAAVNTQTTLTIPAPAAGLYNYVCTLRFGKSDDTTGTVATNAVTTSTNFNSYALKFSHAVIVNGEYDLVENWGIANAGCVKSTSPGTATTFVSPAALLHSAFTWTATYYQAP